MYLSIIVPVYNTENYIGRCLKSIVSNKSDQIEIIIVNDGSIDGSSAICQSYAKGDSRIIDIYQSNQGESSARNKALEIAKGEYVLFVDSDDYIDSSLIDEIIEIAKLQYYDVIRFGLNFIDENNQLIGVFKPEKTSTESCQALLWAISKPTRSDILRFGAYAVKSSVVRNNSIKFDEKIRYGEDQEFTHAILAYSATCYTLEKAYYYYYQHSESLMHTRSLKRLQYIAAIERASRIPKIQSCTTLKKNYEKKLLPYISITLQCMLLMQGVTYSEIKKYKKANNISDWKNYFDPIYDFYFIKFLLYRVFPINFFKALKKDYIQLKKSVHLLFQRASRQA